ncbi:MAG: hypothetical protein QXL94_04715 [Candidatus Parvarchaeum sp.]
MSLSNTKRKTNQRLRLIALEFLPILLVLEVLDRMLQYCSQSYIFSNLNISVYGLFYINIIGFLIPALVSLCLLVYTSVKHINLSKLKAGIISLIWIVLIALEIHMVQNRCKLIKEQ